MQLSVRQPSCALLMFGHQRAGFTVALHLSVQEAAAVAAAALEKGPCPCGHLLFLAPPFSAHTSSEVSGLFLQLQLVSVVMLYFLNQLYPPVLSSLTLTLHLALLTLRSSNCNFSISGRPHRKCIHPNNHMFSNTQAAVNDV